MERYQGFLFFIGAMFVPLFGVVLTDYFLLRRRRLDLHALDGAGGPYWYARGYHRAAILAWVAGFATYEAIQLLGPPSAVPSPRCSWREGSTTASLAVF
jgi:NCS1 family nucleobase:cation symporter-1